MTVQDLPVVNATLNGTAAVLLLVGYTFIRTKHVKAHIATMLTALVVSAAFLACYLYYHYKVGHVKFAGTGFVQKFYYTLLLTHVFLAVVNLPLIIMTVVPALRRRFDKHKRMARWTFPVWLYVSVTGVIVYMMCYQWWGPPLK
ncbi:MAG: putative rane protein [Verrucomicrobiaceae bacterium]|nr:putative rane protein [Verrucomicrobiaceae bacterium]